MERGGENQPGHRNIKRWAPARKLFRPVLAFVISLILTPLLLVNLLSFHPPEARLDGFELGDGSTELLNANVTIINRNKYRGFNITISLLQVWVSRKPAEIDWQIGMVVNADPNNTVGFNKDLTIKNYSQSRPDSAPPGSDPLSYWEGEIAKLKKGKHEYHVSLYLMYHYKILCWMTKTSHSIFLDLNFTSNGASTGGFVFNDQKDVNETIYLFP